MVRGYENAGYIKTGHVYDVYGSRSTSIRCTVHKLQVSHGGHDAVPCDTSTLHVPRTFSTVHRQIRNQRLICPRRGSYYPCLSILWDWTSWIESTVTTVQWGVREMYHSHSMFEMYQYDTLSVEGLILRQFRMPRWWLTPALQTRRQKKIHLTSQVLLLCSEHIKYGK